MSEFSPNLTPKEVIQLGSFGGIYFYDNGGKININHKEFPSDWFKGLDEFQFIAQRNKDQSLDSSKYQKKFNRIFPSLVDTINEINHQYKNL